MSPRLPSTTTTSPAERAYSQRDSKARTPSAPRASKNASWGLIPTTYCATASTIPRQKRSHASAAAKRPVCVAPRSSTGRDSGRGSSPTRSWLRLRSTASASRSPNAPASVAGASCSSLAISVTRLDDRPEIAVAGRARTGRQSRLRRARGPASTRRSRISAVARASGNARWQGSAAVPKNTARAARLALSIRPRRSRRASTIVSTTGAASRRPSRSASSWSMNETSNRTLCPARTPRRANAARRRSAGAGDSSGPTVTLELPDDLTTFHEHRTHLADPRLTRHEACGLEVDDGKACPVEWNRRERSG